MRFFQEANYLPSESLYEIFSKGDHTHKRIGPMYQICTASLPLHHSIHHAVQTLHMNMFSEGYDPRPQEWGILVTRRTF
jgi:hypothetical protein